MTKTRKNYAMRIPAILLILTMTSLCMVSGTFAKYTKSKDVSDTARVAKFAVSLNGTDISSDTAITVNLFAASYLDGKVKGPTVGEQGTKVVAPGTSGELALPIENTGEVAVSTTFTLAETNNGNIPIQYAVPTKPEDTINSSSLEWTPAGEASLTGIDLAVGANGTQRIFWKWVTPTDNGDTSDTALGTAATPATVETTITCTATQDTSATGTGS